MVPMFCSVAVTKSLVLNHREPVPAPRWIKLQPMLFCPQLLTIVFEVRDAETGELYTTYRDLSLIIARAERKHENCKKGRRG